MTLLKPLNLIALLSLAFIVILHLKKHQVKDVKVSNLILWEEVIQEVSDVKRTRINKYLLLIIQLLIAALIVFIFSKPVWWGKSKDNQYTVALDCSMSMKAIENGKSHFDMAKEKSIKYVKNLPSDAKINIVVMNEGTKILKQGINKKEFIKDIKDLKTSYEPLNLEKAYKILKLCGGKIVTFTDKEKLLGDKVVKVGKDIDDLAIVYGNGEHENNEAYCIVRNYSKDEKDCNVVLKDKNNKTINIKKSHISNNAERKIVFTKIPQSMKQINFCIQDDDMILENNKYVIYCDGQFKKKVLLIGNNYFVEELMNSIPYVKLDKKDEYDEYDEKSNKYDLYIVQDKKNINFSQNDNVWYLNPPDKVLNKNEKIEGKIDFEQNNFSQGIKNEEIYGQVNSLLKKMKNYKSVLSINKNPIMMCGYENKAKRIFSTIDWNKTSLTVTPNFPILVDNILKWTFGDLKVDYRDYDYVINSDFNKNTSKTIKLINSKVELQNIVIIVILILLLIEWQVFKHEY
ncbi:VWA domain-containing protein [Haloimpatiens sp. FM7330]|uniref:vWA domain-containing protein n=1 Tax=Haloimpatiens sp. FM7330 TaxID=3298610 RepID=UPI00363A6C61